MAEPVDINVDELRRRARRRLVGAVVLALGVAVVVPMLLETEQKPLGEDVSVKIPPIDDGKFVNRLNDAKGPSPKAAEASAAKAPGETSPPMPASDATPRTSKYDTRIPEASSPPSGPSDVSGAAPAPAANAKSGDVEKPNPAVSSAAPASTASSAPAKAGETSPAHVSGQASGGDTASRAVATDGATSAKPPAGAPARGAGEKVAIDKASVAPGGPAGIDKAAAAPGAHREGFAVQLAAFADDKGANSLAGRLKRAGYAAYTEPLKTSKGTLWRVRVGPYPSREAAVAARDKLKTEGQNGIVAAIK